MPFGVMWKTLTALPRMRSHRQQKTTASIPQGRIPFSSTSRSFRWKNQQMKKCIRPTKAIRNPPTKQRKAG